MEQRGSSRDCWPHDGSRHHHDKSAKSRVQAASVAVFKLGYAGIAHCEYRDGTESDAPSSGGSALKYPDLARRTQTLARSGAAVVAHSLEPGK
jgi:hypothetical protein